jgi:hypothetical protein
MIEPEPEITKGIARSQVNWLFLRVRQGLYEFFGQMTNSTNQQFTVLSVETTGLKLLETVSNSLADTELIKAGSVNGDLESSQWRIGWPGSTAFKNSVRNRYELDLRGSKMLLLDRRDSLWVNRSNSRTNWWMMLALSCRFRSVLLQGKSSSGLDSGNL